MKLEIETSGGWVTLAESQQPVVVRSRPSVSAFPESITVILLLDTAANALGVSHLRTALE
jgi:hypothetical protein